MERESADDLLLFEFDSSRMLMMHDKPPQKRRSYRDKGSGGGGGGGASVQSSSGLLDAMGINLRRMRRMEDFNLR